jgi:hypothetical protein
MGCLEQSEVCMESAVLIEVGVGMREGGGPDVLRAVWVQKLWDKYMYQALTVEMSMLVFWVVTLYWLVAGRYPTFWRNITASIFSPKDGGYTFSETLGSTSSLRSVITQKTNIDAL